MLINHSSVAVCSIIPQVCFPVAKSILVSTLFSQLAGHPERNWWDSYSIVARTIFSDLSNFNFYHFITLHDNKAPG